MKTLNINCILVIALVFLSCFSWALESDPVIFNSSESINPGETIGLQGAYFGDNPEVWYSLIDGKEEITEPQQQILVLNSSDIYVAAQLPESTPLGLYAIWVKNGSKLSKPVFVNKARIMTSEFDEIMPGTKFRLFGYNLALGENQGYIKFVSPDGEVYTSKFNNADTYIAELQAPNKLQAGINYTIFVSNGAGGKYGENKFDESISIISKNKDPLDLGVPWGGDFNFSKDVYNVKTDNRLELHAKGDGLTNDRDAIQQAINKVAEKGGIVYLPKGIYKIDYTSGSGLVLKSKVVLKGDGKENTIINYGYGKPFSTERVKAKYGWTLGWPDSRTEGMGLVFEGFINTSGLLDLSLKNVNDNGSFVHTIKNMPEGGSKVFVKNCEFDFDNGWGLALVNIDKLLIADCVFYNRSTNVRGINAPTRTWPLDVKNSYNTAIRNNTFNYYAGRFGANGCHHIIYESNTFLRDGDHQSKGETGGINYDYVTDIIILNNLFLVKGKPILAKNQGETILSQGGDPNQMDIGVVSEATANTIVVRKTEWQDFTDRISTAWQYAVHPTNYFIAIVDGVGAGQWRTITSNNDTLLTIDRAWDVIPEAGSKYSINQWSVDQGLVRGNYLEDNHQGIMMYCGGHDFAIVENKLKNSGGIYLRADQRLNKRRYNLLWNAKIFNNEMYNDNGLRPSFILMLLAQAKAEKPFGIGAIGVEIRNNLVNASTPNSEKGRIGEGYFNFMGSKSIENPLYNPDVPGLLGTIFENNSAINTDVAFTIGPRAHNTVIRNNNYRNSKIKIENLIHEKWAKGALKTYTDINIIK